MNQGHLLELLATIALTVAVLLELVNVTEPGLTEQTLLLPDTLNIREESVVGP